MKILPSDRFEIETELPLETAVEILQSSVEAKKFIRFSSGNAPFQGEISYDGFKITRIIHYQNSFLPVVTGKFLPGNSGVRVVVHLGLHPLVSAFMYFWFGGLGLGIIGIVAKFISKQILFSPMLLIPFGMMIFGWALVSGGFWFEAKKQKSMLIKLLNGAEISEPSSQPDW
jgi:hypothetical protein